MLPHPATVRPMTSAPPAVTLTRRAQPQFSGFCTAFLLSCAIFSEAGPAFAEQPAGMPASTRQGKADEALRQYEDLMDQSRILSLPPSERAREERLQDLEDERLERCRERRSNFDQCFFFDMAERDAPATTRTPRLGSAPQQRLPTW